MEKNNSFVISESFMFRAEDTHVGDVLSHAESSNSPAFYYGKKNNLNFRLYIYPKKKIQMVFSVYEGRINLFQIWHHVIDERTDYFVFIAANNKRKFIGTEKASIIMSKFSRWKDAN